MYALLALTLLVQAPFQVDTLQPPGGPQVLWHREASPLVALRMSIPLPADLPTGAVELLQELGRPGAAERADALGASLSIRTTPTAAVISVTGPTAAFDALAAILRGFVREPDLSAGSLRQAHARAEDRVLARLEAPERRIRALLEARLTGVPATGFTPLASSDVRALHRHLLDPARLRVVMVGAVPPEIVRSALAGWSAPLGPLETTTHPPARPSPLPATPAYHRWAALAYPLPVPDATIAVAAALVEARARAAGLREGAAGSWEGPGGPALVLMGGAIPGDPAVAGAARITDFPAPEGGAGAVSELARYLRRLVAEAAALARPEGVADAAAGLRHRLLREARTAHGLAEVIGRFADRGTSPARYLQALDAVSPEAVQRALAAALESPAMVVEVRP